MIEKSLRPLYQKCLVDPLARHFTLAPNILTLPGAFVGLIAAAFIPFTPVSALFLLLSGYLDTLDGTVARLRGNSTPFGTALDIVCDRLVEAAILFGLYFAAPERALLTLLMLTSILLCITSFLIVGIFAHNTTQKSFYYYPGLIERSEAFLFFLGMILFPSAFTFLALLFIFGVGLTTLVRLYDFRKNLALQKLEIVPKAE